MKGFKDTTKTQMGHGSYDEVPTRPATAKDVAAAKAGRIITPGRPAPKPQPRVTNDMLNGVGEDRAPGERGAKRFAVGGVVPPVASGGMPAQGKPITSANVNDARTAPPMQNGQRPMVAPRPAPRPTPMMANTKPSPSPLSNLQPVKSTGMPTQLPNPKIPSPMPPPPSVQPSNPKIPSAMAPTPSVQPSNPKIPSPMAPVRSDDYGTAQGPARPQMDMPPVRSNDYGTAQGPVRPFKNGGKVANKAPAKRFAVGGVVPPRPSGMPAQGQPLTSKNMNDARVAPRPAPPAPTVGKGGLPQAWRDNYAADSARRLGANPQPTGGIAKAAASYGDPKGAIAGLTGTPGTKPGGYDPVDSPASRSTGKPSEVRGVPAATSYKDQMSDYDDMAAARSSGALAKFSADRGYKRGGKVVEKATGETYSSKAAMKKHEVKESKSEQRAERKQEGGELLAGRAQSLRDMVGKPAARAGYAKGGSPKSKWC